MNIRVMKKLDLYGGVPICLLLDLVCRIRGLFPFRPPTKKLEKILFMKFFGMGSILLASPMLCEVRRTCPDAHIAFITFESNRCIVERLGLVDTVYTLRTDSFLHFAADLARTLLSVRSGSFDVTVDMEFFAKFSTIMTYLSGSPVRVGYFLRQLWRGDLLTHQIYYNHYKHITEVFSALVAPLGVNVIDFSIRKPEIEEGERASARELLRREGVKDSAFLVGFNVNVSDLALERQWPKDSFRALAIALHERYNVTLLFVGAPSDVEYVTETVRGIPADAGQSVLLAGKTNLGELLAIMEFCNLFITNDSGPLHLASAMGTPTVSFFGPETPQLYGPLGSESLVFYQKTYCSPCLNVFNAKTAPCEGRNVCLSTISPEVVVGEIEARFGTLLSPVRKERDQH